MEHGLLLNGLYVQVIGAQVRQALALARQRAQHEARPSRALHRLKADIYAQAAHPGFRWLTHDAVTLPWKEKDAETNKTRDRLIRCALTRSL